MKSLVSLLGHMLLDCGMRCAVDPSRDIETITARVKHEGLSFITITLPALCSELDRGLSDGRLPHPKGFSLRGSLPRFLGGFYRQVFLDDGSLKEEPSIDAIICLRQILNLAKKVELECSDARSRAALDGYSSCEADLAGQNTQSEAYKATVAVGRIVFSDLLRGIAYADVTSAISPSHGKGSTCERILGNEKYVHKRWHRRLDDAGLTYEEFGVASLMNLGCDDTPDPIRVEPEDEDPVRVIFVPKTLKTPRVIAIEPVCMQFMQQALMTWLVPRIERSKLLGGKVNFTNQEHNRRACRDASITGRRATLDLSEASDRVSNALVLDFLKPFPVFSDMVQATRSTRARLPNGETLKLVKFASMGSAMCFPMEAIAFFSAIVSYRLIRDRLPITFENVKRCSKGILVFGDDIIVEAEEAAAISDHFLELSFKVNQRKSFWNGKFRESCGEDYFRGERVTPVYVRKLPSGDRRNADAVISTVSLCNQLYQAGFWGTVRHLRSLVEQQLGKLPHVRRDAAGIGWWSYSNRTTIHRWNPILHRFEYRGITAAQRYVPYRLDGDPALFRSLQSVGSSPWWSSPADPKRLERYAKRGAFALKRRWLAY